MKMIKDFFKRNEELSLEEKNAINSIIERKNNPTQELDMEQVNLHELVTHLNLEQINELKDLLDEREDELHELYGLKSENAAPSKPKYKGEVNIQEPIHEEDLNNKTYKEEQKKYKEQIQEINDSVAKEVTDIHQIYREKPAQDDNDDEYIELDEDVIVEDIVDTDYKKDLHNTQDDVYLKIIKLFGKENLFKTTQINFHTNLPKNKEILCIGIRKLDAFNKEDDANQNKWFIQKIKQLEELSNFKMLTSTSTQKELFWNREDFPILISFKSTTQLKSIDEFEF